MAGEGERTSGFVLWLSIRTLVNVILLFILVEGFVWCYQFSYKVFADVPYMPTSKEYVSVTIEQGAGAGEIADVMADNGIVEDNKLFLVRMYLGKYSQKVLAGTYTLSPGMTADAICKKICGMQSEETS